MKKKRESPFFPLCYQMWADDMEYRGDNAGTVKHYPLFPKKQAAPTEIASVKVTNVGDEREVVVE